MHKEVKKYLRKIGERGGKTVTEKKKIALRENLRKANAARRNK